MVLVDTSVWIRFLAGREPWASALDELLERGETMSHDFVLGELLIGDRALRAKLLADYALLPRVPTVPHEEVVAFVRARRLGGHGIGWIDVNLLASALVAGTPLWTADKHLATIAESLKIAAAP